MLLYRGMNELLHRNLDISNIKRKMIILLNTKKKIPGMKASVSISLFYQLGLTGFIFLRASTERLNSFI